MFPFVIVHVVEIDAQRNNVFTLGKKKLTEARIMVKILVSCKL